jgi:hypothetical protein
MAQAREKIKVSKEESVMLKWRLLLTTVPVVAAVPALKDVSRGSELSPATGVPGHRLRTKQFAAQPLTG